MFISEWLTRISFKQTLYDIEFHYKALQNGAKIQTAAKVEQIASLYQSTFCAKTVREALVRFRALRVLE